MEEMKIALVQMESLLDRPAENLAKMARFIAAAAARGAKMICFPEMSVSGYSHQAGQVTAETVGGESGKRLSQLADRHGVTVLAGLAEKVAGEKPYISQLVAAPGGSLEVYRKTHLGKKESASYQPGNQLPVFPTPAATIGVEICWDLHFPEVSTILALKGCEIIFAPHASPRVVADRREAWLKYLPARAYDNAVFLAACNLTGDNGSGKHYCGGAMVIDPRGRIVGEVFTNHDEMLVVDLDASLINKIRRQEGQGMSENFYLRSRRPELYGMLLDKDPTEGPSPQPER